MEKVSVIVPCKNEEKYIEQCINSILDNDFPTDQYEIIIVDGMSSDKTFELISSLEEKFDNIVALKNKKETPPSAMNIGLKKAKGDVIIRMDAHTFYPQNYISTLLYWKKKLNADNIGSIVKTEVLTKTSTSVAIKKVLTNRFGVGNGLFRLGVKKPLQVDTVPFGCFTKQVLLEVGGYDERLRRNQDIELNKRLLANGKKIYLIPYTYCVYYARESWTKLAKNNYDNGKWNLITSYYTRNYKSLSLRHFIPLFFISSILFPILLAFLYWPLALLAVFSLILYCTTLIVVTSKMNRDGTTFFHLIWTFIVLHFSYGAGSFVGLFNFHKAFSK